MTEPSAPNEVVTDAPGSGDARVDSALTRLSELDALPVSEHVPVYDDVNRLLQDALADLDEEQ